MFLQPSWCLDQCSCSLAYAWNNVLPAQLILGTIFFQPSWCLWQCLAALTAPFLITDFWSFLNIFEGSFIFPGNFDTIVPDLLPHLFSHLLVCRQNIFFSCNNKKLQRSIIFCRYFTVPVNQRCPWQRSRRLSWTIQWYCTYTIIQHSIYRYYLEPNLKLGL